MLRIFSAALALLLAATTLGHAEPITIALFGAAFASTFAGGLVTLGIIFAANYGFGLLQRALSKKNKNDTAQGIQLQVSVGDNTPLAFPAGPSADAGTRKYAGSWGQEGKTPNAYVSDVRQIADIPLPGAPGLWVDGKKVTVLWSEAPAPQGYPVQEYRKDGVDYLWVRYNDGTQTTSDPFLYAKFSGSEHPWKSTMIGRGCPFVVLTARYNTDLFKGGDIQYLVEPPIARWYDLRRDSTAGGVGPQRWNDWSTWEPSANPAVIIYNIIRGVYYGDEWVYGGQNLPAFRLPASNWMAAANECDRPRALANGGTEPQFRCGYFINGDKEPLAVIEELQKACSGRVSESGGIFRMLVGAPGSAVYSFTDADIIVTEGQSLLPFTKLDQTFNAIEATYPEPAEQWSTKDAPARYSSVLEAQDGGRRLPTPINFAAVPFAVQVQQLMTTMIEDERRFRVHAFALPPDAYPLQTNDVVTWTSARNGYVNKKFIITKKAGRRTYNQAVILKELEPGDYGWSSDKELPVITGPVGPLPVPPQLMTGWQVFPDTIYDENGNARRPTILVKFDGDLDDVATVRIQVRLATSDDVVFDGLVPYGKPNADGTPKAVKLSGTFLPNTNYEVRGIFEPFSARETDWSAWLPVKTLNIRLGDNDVYLPGMVEEINRNVGNMLPPLQEDIRTTAERLAKIAQQALEQDAGQFRNKQSQITQIKAAYETVTAEYKSVVLAATGPGSAIVQRLDTYDAKIADKASVTALVSIGLVATDVNGVITGTGTIIQGVQASVAGMSAQGQFRTYVTATETGAEATVGLAASATANGATRSAAILLSSRSDGKTMAGLVADLIYFTDGSGNKQFPFVFSGGVMRANFANIGTITAGYIQSPDGLHVYNVAAGTQEWWRP